MRFGIIYMAYNRVSGKSYIGQTVQELSARKRRHYSYAKTHLTKFSNALNKYDKCDWDWKILHSDIPEDQLNDIEISSISIYDTYHNGYNSTFGGEQSPTVNPEIAKKAGRRSGRSRAGRKRGPRSEETKKKISESLRGRKQMPFTKTHRKRLSESKQGNKNPMKNKDVARKVSIANLGHENNSKTYEVTFPDGRVVVVTNLNKYCREHGLSPGNMNSVAKGKRKHHKGYTVKELK